MKSLNITINIKMDSTNKTQNTKTQKISMVTFNCKSVKRSVQCIRNLCDKYDVIALQEHWLLPHDIHFLGNIHQEFEYSGKSAVDTSAEILQGRPYGGVAILWRKNLFKSVSVIQCNSVRICAIETAIDHSSVLLINVYMPTDSYSKKGESNLVEFTDCMGEISAIIENCATEFVYVLGDFNAHPSGRFGKEMVSYCAEQDWMCADLQYLGMDSNTYTFLSDVYGSTSWLDHCLVTKAAWPSVVKVYVLSNVYWSDHYPLVVECILDLTKPKRFVSKQVRNKVLWKDRKPEQIFKYNALCCERLGAITCPPALNACSDTYCANSDHRLLIDQLYCDITHTLIDASVATSESPAEARKKRVVGWNKHVSQAHREARLKFQMWTLNGKPRAGFLYDEMYSSRKLFKSRLKWCQQHQEQIKMDIIASYHTKKDFRQFWKKTKVLNGQPRLPVSVEGMSSPKDIANLFKDSFAVKSPLGPSTTVIDAQVSGTVLVTKFSADDVIHVLSHMQRGKSPGHDGLSIEHLQHAGPHIYRVLAMLFTLCMGHSYLPQDMTKTVVVPIVKNKTGDMSSKSNYRPISLATAIVKVLDGLLNSVLDKYIKLQDAQFGFRPGLSTESAILSLKHTVGYYVDRKTPVYAAFLDLSKAFDLVSYDVLWNKLGEANLPLDVINIFKFWYQNQTNTVKWADAISEPYKLECGVRQGGLTSPKLFNIYVDQLIGALSGAHVGCFVDNICLNNISYADDMALLSPSIRGLRVLLHVCEQYAQTHGLKYNEKKSEMLIFKAGKKCPSYVPPVYLNGTALKIVSSFKYLGHIITEDLKDDLDIERERRALATRANMIARRFSRCTAEVKITLFRAYCTSLYTCSLWTNYTRKSLSALRVQYNNALRVLLRLPRWCSASDMFARARADGFHATLRARCAGTLDRLRASTNGILRGIADRSDGRFLAHWTLIHVNSNAKY